MTHEIKFCAIALLAVMFLARVAGAADSQFYKGKTLTILIRLRHRRPDRYRREIGGETFF